MSQNFGFIQLFAFPSNTVWYLFIYSLSLRIGVVGLYNLPKCNSIWPYTALMLGINFFPQYLPAPVMIAVCMCRRACWAMTENPLRYSGRSHGCTRRPSGKTQIDLSFSVASDSVSHVFDRPTPTIPSDFNSHETHRDSLNKKIVPGAAIAIKIQSKAD